MQNFTFHNAVRVHFGKNEVTKLADEIPADAHLLITYGGGSVKKTGLLDRVKAAVKTPHVTEFGGIEANPHYETLIKAIEICKKEKIDFILAVGGGSVIDASKLIAAGAKYAGDPWEIMTSHGSVVKDALPIGTVLTIAATGSEMNNGAVITKAETNDKLFFRSPKVLPRFSILDPEVTFTLPPHQTANGVIDAFVHTLEQYATYPADAKIQDRLAEGLLNTLKEEGPKVLVNPQDYTARANIMWGATLALNGLLEAGVPTDWATHMIGHELTALYGMDHGQTLAVVMIALWKHQFEEKKAKLAQYGRRVWDVTAENDDEAAKEAIAATEKFFNQMGIKTHLKDYDLGEEIIPEVQEKLKAHGMIALGEHEKITPKEAGEILQLAL
ncbi:iron-containing alcohol dehydrogenase [Acetobacteraceae bacterium]|nr:iron-containing alcohol dehydrogenase [Acetobacteraceae bacterium]